MIAKIALVSFPLTCTLVMNLILCKCSSVPSEITVCINLNSSSLAKNMKLVDILPGSKVHLICHYCDEQEDYNAKLWFYKPRGNFIFTEIANYNDKVSKVSITPSHTLTINSFGVNDSGIYVCKNIQMIKHNVVLTYAVDVIFDVNINIKAGTINQWLEYEQSILNPINEKFNKSQEKEFKILRNNYYYFKIISTWDDWGLCQIGNHQKGSRKKVGRCRLHTEIINNNKQINETLKYLFTDGYDHSCRSLELNKTLPGISRIIRNIPEYIAVETCIVLPQVVVTQKDNNCRMIKEVAENSHLTLMCSDINSVPYDIRWFKNNKLLNSTFRNNLGISEEEPHLTIDIYNSLHILHVRKDEEGNYTCSVDGKRNRQFEVKVVSKTKNLNQEFIRYSIYLGFVLSLTITCYCAGVCVAWHRKASFADPLNLHKIKTESLHYERAKLLK